MKGRFSRQAYFYLAILFAACVAVQVFFAGYATFVDPVRWSVHTTFVKIFEYIPLLMLIFSFTGKLSKALRWQTFGLFLLIMAMYATANLTASVPIAGAFHPVIALGMFWMAVRLIPKAWRLAYKPEANK